MYQSLSSFAIFEAMFLNPMEVPEIRLKRTPFNESLGSLQTSISHWTRESVLGSPCTHRRRNFSLCSKSQPFLSRTFRISCMISFGSRDDVVFILHVNRNERGFTASSLPVLHSDHGSQDLHNKKIQERNISLQLVMLYSFSIRVIIWFTWFESGDNYNGIPILTRISGFLFENYDYQ